MYFYCLQSYAAEPNVDAHLTNRPLVFILLITKVFCCAGNLVENLIKIPLKLQPWGLCSTIGDTIIVQFIDLVSGNLKLYYA